MPSFGSKSQAKLQTCDQRLQDIMNEVVKHVDCIIIEGHRDQATQDEYFRTGKSKVQYPNGKHNKTPSLAVDVAPYFSEAPHIRWDDKEAFYHFAGFVMGIAASKGIKLRWGGDWNQNGNFHDSSFNDLPHFELVE